MPIEQDRAILYDPPTSDLSTDTTGDNLTLTGDLVAATVAATGAVTGASADIAGVIQAGSGNVNIVDSTGKLILTVGVPGSAGQQIRTNAGATAPEWFTAPVFIAYQSATASNVTGNGTVYTVIFNATTKSHAGYSTGTGIFTVPTGEGGVYLFCGCVALVSGSSGGTNGVVKLQMGGGSSEVRRLDCNPYGNRNTASGVCTVTFSFLVNLAAADTVKVTVAITGDGSDIAAVAGGSGFSNFAAYKLASF